MNFIFHGHLNREACYVTCAVVKLRFYRSRMNLIACDWCRCCDEFVWWCVF
uniref:Uncharacterized protein n=1 Tax=Kalanchoe fedtschenkoi TaxID=63787 RepID=A0A7N0UMB4_KALFE